MSDHAPNAAAESVTASAVESGAPRPGLVESARLVAADVKLSHSVFALPFAVLAAFLAAGTASGVIDWSRFAGQLVLVVVAMVCARTAAMIANRVLDARIDARNPRTQGRAIPSGALPMRNALGAFAVSGVGFVLATIGFGVFFGNWWPALLALPVLAWISAYGLFKRFTWACHLWLGASLAISPVAAALAIEPAALASPTIWLIAAMVLCWVAGFDVIYALQDVETDRADGLHSMPSRLGVANAMWISRALHAASIAALIAAWRVEPRFGWIFGAAVVATIALLLVEHATVHRWGTTKIALTFFTLNGVISVLIGVCGCVDVLVAA